MQFPGEIQLYAYNSQLYSNWSEAKHEANGLTAIAVLIALSKHSNQANTQLKHITHALKILLTKVRMKFPLQFLLRCTERFRVATECALHYILV